MIYIQALNSAFGRVKISNKNFVTKNSRLIIGLGFLLALIFIFTALVANYIIRENAKAEWSDQLQTLTLILTEHTSQTMFSGVTTLDGIVDILKAENLSNEKSYREFVSKESQHKLLVDKTFGNPIIDVTTFVSNQGEVLNFSRSFPPPKIDLSSRDYFKWLSTNNTQDIFFSEPVRNKGNGKWVFYLARRVNNQRGEFLGLVLVGISAQTFSDFYMKIGRNLGSSSSITLYRNDFTMMTRWPFKDEFIGKVNKTSISKTLTEDRQKPHGVVITNTPGWTSNSGSNDERMIAARSVETYPFVATVAINKDLYTPHWLKDLFWIWSSLLIGLSLLAISVSFLLRANKKIDRELTGRIAAQRALTKSHKALNAVAYKDVLTGLPNRKKFMEDLEKLLKDLVPSPTFSAIIYIDLDNFKNLNSQFGNERGDLLLHQVTRRLLAIADEHTVIYRMGGDEFAILMNQFDPEGSGGITYVQNFAQKILNIFSQTFFLDGIEYRNGASMGISVFSSDQYSIDELMKQVSIALLESKLTGKNNFQIFSPEMLQALDKQTEFVERLKNAISNHQLELYYQAQFDHQLNLIGAEVLLRWSIPGVGNIAPDIFIPMAEKNGLIRGIGDWVLTESLNSLHAWSTLDHMKHLVLALNISAQQMQTDDFADVIMAAILEKGVAPEKLKLELTESLLITDFQDVAKKMSTLKQFGVQLALDDFGTGYSSLSYLKHLALHELKIDKSFIRDLLTDENDINIVRTIILLGKSLELSIIAEGVETVEQYRILSSIGCNSYQGYLLSKPISKKEFEAFVVHYQSLPRISEPTV